LGSNRQLGNIDSIERLIEKNDNNGSR